MTTNKIRKTGQIIYGATELLLKPDLKNRVVLNYWNPGYKIQKKFLNSEGKEEIKKVFVPTNNFEMALAHLKNEYGNKEYLKYKEDVHPGHASIEARNEYLSLGADEEIHAVGFRSQHRAVYSDSFIEDVIGFLRGPEQIFDFYSLNPDLAEQAIKQFKSSPMIYALLGSRLFINKGESCATSSYICLEAGGIENLLRIDQRILSKRGILTPSGLASYAADAQKNEHILFPETIELSKGFILQRQKQAEAILSRYTERSKPDEKNDEESGLTKKI